MTDVAKVVAAAQRLGQQKDEAGLEVSIGLREKAGDPQLDPAVDPPYDSTQMGALDDLKALGRRVAARWNRELYGLVCAEGKDAQAKDRVAIIQALNVGEVAVIGAVAAALMGIGTPAPIAAAAAPLIARRFIWPAREELCGQWRELIEAAKASGT